MVDLEGLDSKFFEIVNTQVWKSVQKKFNKAKHIFIFGHGGNMGIADHAAIDMSRLTDKNVIAPGSGVLATSIISDQNFISWLSKWLEFRTRGLDPKNCLAIGLSCSTTGNSSDSLMNALTWASDNKIDSILWAAQPKNVSNNNITALSLDCTYYHTSEIISLALTYELIHGAGFECPSIAGKANKRKFEALGIESEVKLDESNLHVPPGFESELKNIAIDFDGVIHNFDKGWYDGTCYGEPLEGSLDAIKKLSETYNIIIFTAKAKPDRPLVNGKTGKELVEEWLSKHKVLDLIDSVTSEKPRAIAYIDDKAVNFTSWKNFWKTDSKLFDL